MRFLLKNIALVFTAFAFAGCAEMNVASHFYKKSTNKPAAYYAPAIKGDRKIGKPYAVLGKTYYPISNSEGFKQKGIASWYGKDFHRKKTANGERYNMHAMTAAHPILPLPTWVRVTNLENGKSVVVRVNDRGPFLHGRVIDLSYRAAHAIDMAKQGTAPVLVEALPTDGSLLRSAGRGEFYPANKVSSHGVSAPEEPVIPKYRGFTNRVSQIPKVKPVEVIEEQPKGSHFTSKTQKLTNTRIFVQVGAFGSLENAEKQVTELKDVYENTKIMLTERSGQTLYRVRIGPYTVVADADEVLSQVVRQGYQSAVMAIE